MPANAYVMTGPVLVEQPDGTLEPLTATAIRGPAGPAGPAGASDVDARALSWFGA